MSLALLKKVLLKVGGRVIQMNDKCYRCCYYDELFDGMDEYPQCTCEEDERPKWCPERSNTDENS